eukprot:1393299-Amorphochlora_amoeboformis.AAC.1
MACERVGGRLIISSDVRGLLSLLPISCFVSPEAEAEAEAEADAEETVDELLVAIAGGPSASVMCVYSSVGIASLQCLRVCAGYASSRGRVWSGRVR